MKKALTKEHKPSECPSRGCGDGTFGCTDCLPTADKKERTDLEKCLNFCPFCGEEETLVTSDEDFVDYYVVGETYRCFECGRGFGCLFDKKE